MASNPYYWTTADNTIHAMEFLDGGGAVFSTVPQYGISYDGSKIIGYVYDAESNYFPAMWTNGVLTELPIPDGVTSFLDARLISADGTVIVGLSSDGQVVLWTDNGATAAILPQIANSAIVGTNINCISNDGTTICGSSISTMTGHRVAVYWDSAVSGDYTHPIALPNSRSNSSAFVADMQAHDVSYIFGWTFSTDFNEDHLPLYWSPEGAETEHPLTTGSYNGGQPVQCSNGNSAATFVPNNGNSGPFVTDNERFYWTAVDSPPVAGYYGTLHQYGLLGGFSTIRVAFALSQPKDTGTTAVGSTYNSDGTDNVGCVWYATVAQQLEVPDTLSVPMEATCVAGQGYPIGGYGYTLDLSYRRSGFWNILDSGHWTTLQVLNENDDTFITNISRNGAVIYGYHSPSPVVPATLSMADLECQQNATLNHVTLQWSDDAGASWSNGVQQSLGDIGRYLTSLQWRRTGMARNRIYQISWSCPQATALQGVWLLYEIAGT